MKQRVLAMAVVGLFVLAACGDDGSSGSSSATTAGSNATTESDGGDATDPSPTDVEWIEQTPGGDCQCADGSEFSFYSRDGDPDKVLLYFQGGGACFTAETCSFTDGTYLVQATGPDDGGGGGSGIFDFANPDNPFADWSVVFVPYCTGDVHIGDNIEEYADDLTVNHVGYVNANAALEHVVENYGDASEVFVSGSSAGGVPSPLFGGLAAGALPDAEVAVLADASGGYPDNPPVNATIGNLWGTFENVPDWTSTEGLAPEDYSIPGLFELAGAEHPDIRFARYDNAYDEVQQSFSQLSGIGDGDVLSVVQTNEENIEAAGVDIASYIAPGTDHTILAGNGVYDLEVEGTSFLDWLTGFVNGEDVGDVACTDCGEPNPEGADIGG